MLNLTKSQVLLNQQANNKEEAIRIIAKVLEENGNVAGGYVNGMLDRENQTATYLDFGVAIPHGTTQTRDQVLKTGVAVVQFPQGVEWNEDGDKAFVCFGIAASSNEHLSILKAITKVIDDEDVAETLARETNIDEFVKLIVGEQQFVNPALFDFSAQATDLTGLVLLGAAKLQAQQLVNPNFLTNVLNREAVALGNGVYLASATKGNKANTFALVRPAAPLFHKGEQVKAVAVVTLSEALPQLNKFLSPEVKEVLASGSEQQVEELFKG